MSNKTTRKKRAFKQHCLEQARRGMVNSANGQWYAPSANDRMGAMQLAGYKKAKA